MIKLKYDVIVVGGGHAWCEACLAAARMGKKTLLITGNFKNIADMPCNPSIGGSAKGIVVREIDALGGQMGINADKTHLQIKMLNVKKGPGVRSLRAQGCKDNYPKEMLNTLKHTKNLDLKEDLVKEIRKIAEEARVSIRGARRDGLDEFKAMQKNSEITEDELRGAEDSIQKLTDKKIEEIDRVLADKEKEVMNV